MTPYVARMEYLNLLDLWKRERLRTQAWWQRIKSRPSFAVIDERLALDEKDLMWKHGSAIRGRVAARLKEYLAA